MCVPSFMSESDVQTPLSCLRVMCKTLMSAGDVKCPLSYLSVMCKIPFHILGWWAKPSLYLRMMCKTIHQVWEWHNTNSAKLPFLPEGEVCNILSSITVTVRQGWKALLLTWGWCAIPSFKPESDVQNIPSSMKVCLNHTCRHINLDKMLHCKLR